MADLKEHGEHYGQDDGEGSFSEGNHSTGEGAVTSITYEPFPSPLREFRLKKPRHVIREVVAMLSPADDLMYLKQAEDIMDGLRAELQSTLE
jgi:hypothetical protein